ncbi:hypothetical protein QVD17_26821 [Tagetes erecta]|uniref:Uncharacterized protein n=1 Tax=Tagetes erecta TaxID=13708 RepID=A0AAD8KBQ1_TARER|nr:hypothetical protein QVD17_26821 [Tagetes erecta]
MQFWVLNVLAFWYMIVVVINFIRFYTTTQFQLRFHFTNSIPFHFTIFNHEADSTTTTTVATGSSSTVQQQQMEEDE